MKPLYKPVILYLEALLLTRAPVVQQLMAENMGIGRQNMANYFAHWMSVSNLPVYDKNKKCWIKAKNSRSKLFASKKEAQFYIDNFDFVLKTANKKL